MKAYKSRIAEEYEQAKHAANAQVLCDKLLQKLETHGSTATYAFHESELGLLRRPRREKCDEEVEKLAEHMMLSPFYELLDEHFRSKPRLEFILRWSCLEEYDTPDILLYPRCTANQSEENDVIVIVSGEVKVKTGMLDEWTTLSPGCIFGNIDCDAAGTSFRKAESFITGPGASKLLRIQNFGDKWHKFLEIELIAKVEFLRTTPLFKDFENTTLHELTKVMSTRKYKTGEIIVKQGEAASDFFILMMGSVRVIKDLAVQHSLVKKGFICVPGDMLEPVSDRVLLRLSRLKEARLGLSNRQLEKSASALDFLKAPMSRIVSLQHQCTKDDKYGHKARFDELRKWQTKVPLYLILFLKNLLIRNWQEIKSAGGAYVSALSFMAQTNSSSKPNTARSGSRRFWDHQNTGTLTGRDRLEHMAEGTKASRFRPNLRMKVSVEVRKLWCRGSFFGEASLLNKEPKWASVVAASPVEVLVLARLDFLRHFGGEKFAALFSRLAEEAGYVTDDMLLTRMLEQESNWTELKQEVVQQLVFGQGYKGSLTEKSVKPR